MINSNLLKAGFFALCLITVVCGELFPLHAETKPQLQIKHEMKAAAFSANSAFFATSAHGRSNEQAFGEVKIWETKTGKVVRSFRHVNDKVVSLAFSPDGLLLAAGGGNLALPHAQAKVILWNLRTDKVDKTLDGFDEDVTNLAFSLDGRNLAAVGYLKNGQRGGKKFLLWDIHRSSVLWSQIWDDITTQFSFAATPKGEFLMVTSGYVDGSWDYDIQMPGQAAVEIWDIASQKKVGSLLDGSQHFYDVAISPMSNLAAGISFDSLTVWNLVNRQSLFVLHPDSATKMFWKAVFSPDEKMIAVVILNRTDGSRVRQRYSSIHICDARSGELLKKLDESEVAEEYITGIAFSPDGLSLLVGGKEIKLWKI